MDKKITCSLYEAINGLTKANMNTIRKKYGFKSISNLNKAELASELSRLIPLEFNKYIFTLDQGRYDFIKTLIDKSGYVMGIDISVTHAEAFMNYSMVFTGIYDDESLIIMPEELIEIFSQADGYELKKAVQRNTQWIGLTHGMLYFYGVMEPWQISRRIGLLTGEKIDFTEFLDVMSFASDFYGQFFCSIYGYRDRRVQDEKKIVQEHGMRPKLDYFSFTKEQLIEASNPDYVDRTPQMNSFTSFLSENLRLTIQEINEIAVQTTNMIKSDLKPAQAIQHMQKFIEFPSFEFVQDLSAKTMDLHNNTRQWVLKGHTPNEIFKEERSPLKPLPTMSFKADRSNSKVIDLVTHIKIGRNEPCPCGSGKKYKKCCGK